MKKIFFSFLVLFLILKASDGYSQDFQEEIKIYETIDNYYLDNSSFSFLSNATLVSDTATLFFLKEGNKKFFKKNIKQRSNNCFKIKHAFVRKANKLTHSENWDEELLKWFNNKSIKNESTISTINLSVCLPIIFNNRTQALAVFSRYPKNKPDPTVQVFYAFLKIKNNNWVLCNEPWILDHPSDLNFNW